MAGCFRINCINVAMSPMFWLAWYTEHRLAALGRPGCSSILVLSKDLVLVRPPDTVVGGHRFYCNSFIYLIFVVSYPTISMNGTQPKPATCSEVSAIWKCMSEILGTSSPYKSRDQKPRFSTTSQLNGKFNGLYLRMKHDIHETRRGRLCPLKMPWIGPQTT